MKKTTKKKTPEKTLTERFWENVISCITRGVVDKSNFRTVDDVAGKAPQIFIAAGIVFDQVAKDDYKRGLKCPLTVHDLSREMAREKYWIAPSPTTRTHRARINGVTMTGWKIDPKLFPFAEELKAVLHDEDEALKKSDPLGWESIQALKKAALRAEAEKPQEVEVEPLETPPNTIICEVAIRDGSDLRIIKIECHATRLVTINEMGSNGETVLWKEETFDAFLNGKKKCVARFRLSEIIYIIRKPGGPTAAFFERHGFTAIES